MRGLRVTLCVGMLVPFACAAALSDSWDSPAAVEQTQRLNQAEATRAAGIGAQVRERERQLELQREKEAQQSYKSKAIRQTTAPDRVAAQSAARDQSSTTTTIDGGRLIGARVETASGDGVGKVAGFSLSPKGQLYAVRVTLDDGGSVWLDSRDLDYDKKGRMLVTGLTRHDLYSMSREQY